MKRVLIVDDEDDIRSMLETLFVMHGFEVDVLGDGIAATDLKTDYDAILLDLKMPIFDGERLIDYWNMTAPETLQRVIVMSGYSYFARQRAYPTFAVVLKPFDPLELLKIVERCIENAPRRGGERSAGS
ncbi:MAG TPA: response regulator [Thermoanaerobaculia bacterium]|nr:response regulator [Thermoanaerobaculia bacterium]